MFKITVAHPVFSFFNLNGFRDTCILLPKFNDHAANLIKMRESRDAPEIIFPETPISTDIHQVTFARAIIARQETTVSAFFSKILRKHALKKAVRRELPTLSLSCLCNLEMSSTRAGGGRRN